MSDINPNEVNPFLTDIPVVSIVTQVRLVNGVEVETPVSDCIRVWGRLNGAAKRDAHKNPIIPNSQPIRIIPDPYGMDKQRNF
ncbi:hypothetical protein RsoM2USA_412 [Ralstonia phage RsoM2USA]|nr:hypothetical protein RsoM2USA_412 [Ralstonia phage RsoM2USA]